MDAAKKGNIEEYPSRNPQESPSSNFATHPITSTSVPTTPKLYDLTEKPLNHYSPSYLSSGKDSYVNDRFSNQLPGLCNNEDISYPNIQRPAYPFYLSPLNKVADENEDNRSTYPLYSNPPSSSMRNGYRIYHPSDDYLDFFSPHSTTMSFDPFKEYNDSKQIVDPSTPFFTLGSNPPLFDKLYYSPAMSCKTDLTPPPCGADHTRFSQRRIELHLSREDSESDNEGINQDVRDSWSHQAKGGHVAVPPRSDVRITVFHLSEEGDRDSEGGGKEPAAHTSGAFQSVHTAQATQSGRSALQGASKRRERDYALEYDPLLNRERDQPLNQTQTQLKNQNQNQNSNQNSNQHQSQYRGQNRSQYQYQYQYQYQNQYQNRDRRRDQESEGSSDEDASFQENESEDEPLIPRYGTSAARSRSHPRRPAAAKEKKTARNAAGTGGNGGSRSISRSMSQVKRFFLEDESSSSSKTTRLEESPGRVLPRGPAGSSSDGSSHDPIHSKHTCNCRKSRCLKLYCECFASDVFCNGCNCVNCKNNPEHLKEREEVKQALIQRNPHVFEPHVVWDTPATRTNLRGCKCQKTRCVKKYCDCFQNGICCGPNCRCVDCKNTEEAALNRALSA